MKKLFLFASLTVLMLFSQKVAAEPWRVVYLEDPDNRQLGSISIPSSSVAYVVGGGALTGGPGIILKTENGGDTWVEKYRNEDMAIYAIDCPTTLICYAAGSNSTILRTLDGGTTWPTTSLSDLRSTTFNDIKVVSLEPRVVVAVGNNESILRLAGGVWTVRTSPLPSTSLTSIAFTGDIGYIGADNGQILKSINGGTSWGFVATPTDLGGVEDVFTLDENKLRIAAFRVGKSDTGGEDFSTHHIPPGGLSSIAFLDDLNGWVSIGLFGGAIHRTTDGGTSWIRDEDTSIQNADGSPFSTGTFIRKIRFRNENLGFVIGDGVIARRYIPAEMGLRRSDERSRVFAARPDLTPSDGWSIACSAAAFHLIAQVRNLGPGGVRESMSPFQVRIESLDEDNNVVGSATYDIAEPIPATWGVIVPNPNGEEGYRLFNPLNLEQLIFRMTVDVDGSVSEANEDNNVREQQTTCAISDSGSSPAGGGAPSPNPQPRGKDGKKDSPKKKFVKPKK